MAETAPLRQRNLAEHFLDTAQVPHPGFGRATYPAAYGLDGNAQLTRRCFLGKPFAPQCAGHPFRECLGLAVVAGKAARLQLLFRVLPIRKLRSWWLRRHRVEPGRPL